MKSLRVGVICEGPTDYHAIEQFMKPALAQLGVDASFIPIQPDMGPTLPDAGWGNVELWLKRNPPDIRVMEYFGGGPFQSALSKNACDVLMIQMDSDILDEPSFRAHLLKEDRFQLPNDLTPEDRGRRIVEILEMWSGTQALTKVDQERHVFAPAVESTESWCVAAFDNAHASPELLRGDDLIQAFMTALERSESRPLQHYAVIDKNPERREAFCTRHATGYHRIGRACPHFEKAVADIHRLLQ